MVAVGNLDELRHDAKTVTRLSDTAFEDGIDVELLPHRANVEVLVLELKSGGAGDDVQAYHLGQGIDELLR